MRKGNLSHFVPLSLLAMLVKRCLTLARNLHGSNIADERGGNSEECLIQEKRGN